MPEFRVDAGVLDKRISIYSQPSGESVINEATTVGTLVTKAWAELNPRRGSAESVHAGGDGAEYTDVWRTRYFSSVSEGMRITWQSMTWRIVGITILGSRTAMDIEAARVV